MVWVRLPGIEVAMNARPSALGLFYENRLNKLEYLNVLKA